MVTFSVIYYYFEIFRKKIWIFRKRQNVEMFGGSVFKVTWLGPMLFAIGFWCIYSLVFLNMFLDTWEKWKQQTLIIICISFFTRFSFTRLFKCLKYFVNYSSHSRMVLVFWFLFGKKASYYYFSMLTLTRRTMCGFVGGRSLFILKGRPRDWNPVSWNLQLSSWFN